MKYLIIIALLLSNIAFAGDMRSTVQEKLEMAITSGNAQEAQQWAATLLSMEQGRIAKEAGDAVIPVLKGYAGVTKEFGPQLEAMGPLLKLMANKYITAQLNNGLINEKEAPVADGVRDALNAKTAAEVVTAIGGPVSDIFDKDAKAQKERQDQWKKEQEAMRLEEQKLRKQSK